jgi:hypothetical protein
VTASRSMRMAVTGAAFLRLGVILVGLAGPAAVARAQTAPTDVDRLIGIVKSGTDSRARSQAALMLARIGAVGDLLEDRNDKIRLDVIRAIAIGGRGAGASAPHVVQLLRREPLAYRNGMANPIVTTAVAALRRASTGETPGAISVVTETMNKARQAIFKEN